MPSTIEALYTLAEAAVLVMAAKVDDLKAKYPDFEDEIDQINAADPTPTKKYLQWGVKHTVAGEDVDDVVAALSEYHDNLSRISKKDIYQLSFSDVIDILKNLGTSKAAEKATKREEAKKDAVYLYQDDRFLVVHPLSMAASCHYGMGTKWCISAKMSNYYNAYAKDNTFFYFVIDKKAPPKDTWSKVAIVLKKGNKSFVELFDSTDKKHTLTGVLNLDNDATGLGPRLLEFVAMGHRHMLQQPDTWQHQFAKEAMNAQNPQSIVDLYAKYKGRLDSGMLQDIARVSILPEDVALDIAKTGDSDVKITLLKHTSFPSVFDLLVTDNDPMVFLTAMEYTKHDVREKYIDKLIELRKTLDSNRLVSVLQSIGKASKDPSVLTKLVNTGSATLVDQFADRPDLPAEISEQVFDKFIDKFKSDNSYYVDSVLTGILNSPATPARVVNALFDLAEVGHGNFQKSISHPNLSADRLDKALSSKNRTIVELASKNPSLDPAKLMSLLTQPDVPPSVVESVAKNKAITPEAVQFMKDGPHAWNSVIVQELITNPAVSEETVDWYMTNYKTKPAYNWRHVTLSRLVRAITDRLKSMPVSPAFVEKVVDWVFGLGDTAGFLTIDLLEQAISATNDSSIADRIMAYGKDKLLKTLDGAKNVVRFAEAIVRVAEAKPHLISDNILATLAKGARKGPGVLARELLEKRKPPKKTRQKKTSVDDTQLAAATAESLHRRRAPATALLAVEEAVALLLD